MSDRFAYDLYVICISLAYMYCIPKSFNFSRLKFPLRCLLFAVQFHPLTGTTALYEHSIVKKDRIMTSQLKR